MSTTAWEDRLDGLFAAERTRVQPVTPDVTVTDAAITFETAAVRLVAERDPLCFKLYDKEGTLLHSDLAGAPYILDSNRRVTHYSAMAEEDCFYGFGEKTGLLNKNKRFLRERATDAMGYDAEKMDTLYKHIPFYIQLSRATRKAVGVFYNNFYESVFNMGCEKSNYWSRYSYWQADGKDSDDAVLNFIDTIKEEGFPIDGFHLSSGYASQNGKRCFFTLRQPAGQGRPLLL